MLILSFATRTDSTLDPLTEQGVSLAKEFMDLTGEFVLAHQFAELPELICPRTIVKYD